MYFQNVGPSRMVENPQSKEPALTHQTFFELLLTNLSRQIDPDKVQNQNEAVYHENR